jgi:hypothetical protein|tara:strand:+ start:125 stop:406 length:282 start_codon:yes stop_codon:yes gene_type:complete
MSSYQIPSIYTDELGLHDETRTSHGNNSPYMDMYTWIQATDNNYISYSYPKSVKKTQKTQDKKNTFEIRKQRKLLRLVTNKVKRNRLNKFTDF